MTQPLVRRALDGDIPSIVRFNLSMALETESLVLEPDIIQKGVETVFRENSHGFYIVCEVEEQVQACLMITYEWSDWRNGLFWWIQSVYVEKDFRKKGLYKLMYSFIKSLTDKNDGIAGVRLYVDDDNRKAQNVYKKLGMLKTNYQLFEYSKVNLKK